MKQKVVVRIRAVRRRSIRIAAGALPRARCAACGREVETLTREQTAEILGAGERELNEFIAAGRVHVIHLTGGRLRVCKDSLFSE